VSVIFLSGNPIRQNEKPNRQRTATCLSCEKILSYVVLLGLIRSDLSRRTTHTIDDNRRDRSLCTCVNVNRQSKAISFAYRIDKFELNMYPYPTYVPSQVLAGCMSCIVGSSLVAWLIQSYQARFRPARLNILLLISHLMIFVEFIVRTVANNQYGHGSSWVFLTSSSLFAIGQRTIIVGNFVFIMEIRREKSRVNRVIVLAVMSCAITSGILMIPANSLSFSPHSTSTSYIFRVVSSAILLVVTLLFFPVWHWSRTINDTTRSALVLIVISSTVCVLVALYTLIQSLPNTYVKLNNNERWFYACQMIPLVVAHCTWSIVHPKRTLAVVPLLTSVDRFMDTTCPLYR
jgi:hypothetical protein